MNKHFKFILASAAIVAGLAGAVSCQDLKGELETLTNKVNALDTQVATLQQAINAGKLITSVETVSGTPGGIKINFSDGSSQTINNGNNGKDGKDGAAGADADVWTIVDGYWAKNGVPTEWKAVGTDGANGADGADGKDGADGADGKDGCYYVPNAETGVFDKYTPNADGSVTVEPTTISFVPEGGVSAVFDPETGYLVLSVDEDIFLINMLAELKSLVTVPHAYYEGVEAVVYRHLQYQPLVWNAAQGKNHLTGDVSDEFMEGKVVAGVPVVNDIYPLMTVEYYVNPVNADLSGLTLADINAGLKVEADLEYYQTRSASSLDFDIEAVDFALVDEDGDYLDHLGHRVLQVKYLVTGDAAVVENPLFGTSEITAFALSVPTETGWVSSDYVALYKQDLDDLRIVDPKAEVSDKFVYIAGASAVDYGPDDVYGAGSREEHYRRAIYGMNFDATGALLDDPDSWIVNRTDVMAVDPNFAIDYPTAVANDVKLPNYRDPATENVHLSVDTVLVYNETIDLMDIVAAHNWVLAGGVPPVVALPTGGFCTEEELNDAALKELGLQWRFEVVRDYRAGTPLTNQENFIWINGDGSLDADNLEPGEGEAIVSTRNFTISEPSIAAIGRHPVIRVSLIDNNEYNLNADGTKPIVESAYIKILIVPDEVVIPDDALDYDFHVEGSEGTLNPPFVQAIPKTEYPNPIGFNCDNGFNGTTTVQWTNETIYHNFGDKITFHDPVTGYAFNARNVGDPDYVAFAFNPVTDTYTGELGTVTEIVIPNPATGATHVINWTIAPDDIWTIASQIDAPLEIIRHCDYRKGAAKIVIALHVKIAPFSDIFPLDWSNTAVESDYIEQYWIAHKHDADMAQWDATAHHVATPAVGDTDPANCTWINDINSSFVTNNAIDFAADATLPVGSLRVVRDGVSVTDVQYFFHPINNVNNATFQCVRAGEAEHAIDNVTIRVSADGLTLWAYQGATTAGEKAALTREAFEAEPAGKAMHLVATIVNYAYSGGLNTVPFNTLQYHETEADMATRNELSLALLNTDGFYAYLGATGTICAAAGGYAAGPKPVEISFHGEEYFKVDFLRPVSIDPAATKHFVDAVDFGQDGSYLRFEDIVNPYDWRMTWGNGTPNTHFNPSVTPAHAGFPTYYGFYGLAGVGMGGANDFVIHAAIDEATCNLGGEGSAVPATIVLQANEINNTPAYALASWATLTAANDGDWYTDLAGVNTDVYSYNNVAIPNIPLQYTLTAADIAAGKQSNYGWITYNNNGVAVGAFTLKVPMYVYYKWGTLKTTVTIEVATTI